MEAGRRIERIGLGVLAGLILVGVWLRVSSLGRFPDPNADEAYYGVQAGLRLRGEPSSWRTPNGNPLDPFNAGAQYGLLALFGPRWWVLRAPAAASGVLAILAASLLVRRRYGPTAARVAAGGMAVLPIAIGTSRLGFDSSQTPLFSILAFGCAVNGWWVWMALAYLGAFLAHPTNLFLLPGLGIVGLERVAAMRADRRGRWVFAGVMAGLTGLSAWLGVSLVDRSAAKAARAASGAGGLVEAPVKFVEMLLATPPGGATMANGMAVLGGILVVTGGLVALRRRGLDGRSGMALVAGVGANLAAVVVVAGAGALCSGNPVDVGHYRYGLSLAGPAVMAAAVLLGAIVDGSREAGRRRGMVARAAAVLALGVGLLLVYGRNRLDPFRPDPVEWLGTPWVDGPTIDDLIVEEIRGEGGGPVKVLAESWWLRWPLVYRGLGVAGRWQVAELYEHEPDPAHTDAAVGRWLENRGLAVGYAGGPLEKAVRRRFAEDRLKVAAIRAKGAVRDERGKRFGTVEVRVFRLRARPM